MIEIHTDGSCLENPGNGGWAAIININGKIKKISGSEKNTTNNRMELMAPINALKSIDSDEEINKIKSAAEDAALLEAMGAVTEEEDNVESLAGLSLNEDNIVKLASKGIKNKDDLAELSIDELQEIIDISEDDASKMIMKAREHWFD